MRSSLTKRNFRRILHDSTAKASTRRRPARGERKMRMFSVALGLMFVALCADAAPAHPDAKSLAIVGVTMISPERDDAAAPDQTVVIEGERIVAVGPQSKVKIPAQAQRIDGKGKWLIPGMIDGHVHFFQSGNVYTRPDGIDLNAVVPYAQEVARNKARLPATFKVWLASGVTSVIDVGGPFWNFDVRDAARKSDAAPRVETTGPLISMVSRPQLDLGDPPIIKVDSEQAARDLVKRELPYKPDYIKVWYIHQPNDDFAAQERIVKATADAAHAAHIRLAVHATELATAKSALRAGADYLVHSVFDEPIDDEFIAMMKQHHAMLCPTLFVTSGYRLVFSDQWQATPEEQRLADPQILAAVPHLEKIDKAKVPPRVVQMMADKKPV